MWISVLTAIFAVTIIALAAGLLLGFSSRRLPATSRTLIDRVNDLLPQTQCAQCGYPGCRPYAAAIVDADAPINLCPPGGTHTVQRLAELLDREVLPLGVANNDAKTGAVAIIDESLCIGCTYCRDACPVDAISGAHRFMHTVIASECTGCELCVIRCPVDCIRMVAPA
ncbi:MAG: electron transport complex subunit RsxB [Woeseiaceae bacterium]